MHPSLARDALSLPKDFCHLFQDGEPDAKRVVDLLRYKKKDIAQAIDIPVSSVRYDEKMPDELRERLIEWAIAMNTVAGFFEGDVDKTVLWFEAPNPHLGGWSPRDMIRAGRFRKLFAFITTAIEENSGR